MKSTVITTCLSLTLLSLEVVVPTHFSPETLIHAQLDSLPSGVLLAENQTDPKQPEDDPIVPTY